MNQTVAPVIVRKSESDYYIRLIWVAPRIKSLVLIIFRVESFLFIYFMYYFNHNRNKTKTKWGENKMKPTRKPLNPCFSSGPCAKHPDIQLKPLKMHRLEGHTGANLEKPNFTNPLSKQGNTQTSGRLQSGNSTRFRYGSVWNAYVECPRRKRCWCTCLWILW